MKRHTVLFRPLPCLAWGGAWVCLSGLTLVRLWALLYGRLPSLAIPALAVLLTGVTLLVGWRLEIPRRFLLPFGPTWKTALAAALAFVPGMALDTSYQLFTVGDMAIGGTLFRLLCGAGSGLFFACVVLALLWAGRSFGRLPMPWGTAVLAVALVVNVITALYCTGTATVYYWDTNIYWSSSTMLAGQHLGLSQLRLVAESVITQEYNYLLSFPLSLVMRVLGTNRYVFLFATVNLYVLPALLGMLVLGRRSKYGGILLCCATPMLLYTALTGFVDVAAAGAGIWAFVIYTDESRPQAARGILTGGLLTLVFLLRRYFFFFTVSFGIAAFLALLVRRSQWKSFLTMAVTGVGFSLFFGQSFVVSQVLSANYADTYSAYDQGRWIDLVMLCRYYGYIMMAVALVCAVFLLLRSESRYSALLSLCQPVLCLFLFTRIQSHGQQHLLLYLPAFCFALAGGMELLPERRAVRWVPWALALCTLGSSFLPRPQPSHPSEIAVPDPLPSFTYVPGQRTDLAQLVALRVYVDSLSAEEQKTAAVLASSFTFNSSIYDNTLRSLNIPQSGGPSTSMIYFATVDKRDGFSWNALTADYLIVADPVQTHLGADNQHILTVLAQPVLDGTGIGTAYRRLDQSFPLEDGVTVYVYERTREITQAEYQAISDTLVALYPDYAQQYQPPAG
ncbi:hypothetical protein [Pseudoflavonifractor phocaeensis]|uniref:hypothetical protein n=1 Tax=Pseudoflavonifractor phocaeensis TaxID=1870988 RepID=UPI001958C1C9|nr:hypothetical protein [Pseudoflavonifractor phocaeensis]MBM6723361.1 hypothetical protein [Pseudoflavonifractor phocaeensis]